MRVAKFLGAPTDHYVPFPHVGKEVDQSSSLANAGFCFVPRGLLICEAGAKPDFFPV